MANWLPGYALSSFVSEMTKMSNLPLISQFLISWNLKPAMLLALIWPILTFLRCVLTKVSKLVQVLLWSSFLVRVCSPLLCTIAVLLLHTVASPRVSRWRKLSLLCCYRGLKITEPKNSFTAPFPVLGIHLQKFIFFPHRYLTGRAIL